MNMDTDDRLGNRDEEAARLFAHARAFRPSARARRRTLRALGLPVSLSLVGSSLAHAAHLFTASLKGWGIVAGVVGAVSAAGSVAYVASAPSASRSLASASAGSNRGGGRRPPSRSPVARAVAGVPSSLPDVVDPPAARAPTADAAPPVAVRRPPLLALDDVPSISSPSLSPPMPARRASPRPRSRTLPSDSPSTDGSPPPPVSSLDGPAERRIVGVAPLEPPPLVPEISAQASGGPAFRAPGAISAQSPRSLPPSSALRGELALVSEAQRLLRAGDGAAARTVLDGHARTYPNGVLAEEVEVLRLRALLAEGDARGARQAADSFLRRHPASPLAARVRSLLFDLGPSRPYHLAPPPAPPPVPLPPEAPSDHGESL